MRVLGIDPGLTRCGIGVVDSGASRSVSLVAVGVARSSTDWPQDVRILHIGNEIERWLGDHAPDRVAIERVFADENVASVMGTAQVVGVATYLAARRGIPVALHTPTEVKAAVTGSGGAGKAQVQQMVARILHLAAPPQPADAADALALAICHLWRPVVESNGGDQAQLTPAQRRWAAAEAAARRHR